MDANVITARAPTVLEINQLGSILNWIGFTTTTEHIVITTDVLTTYDDLLSLKQKDITEPSEAFSRRTTNNGKINLGVRRTKKLKWLVHWAQDFLRIFQWPCVDRLKEPLFLAKLTVASERAEVRRCLKQQSDVKAKESTPGPLVLENKWLNWEPKFRNYLYTILGMK